MCVGLLWATLGAGAGTGKLWAAPQDQQQKPAYTLAEYNAYKAADAEQNPQEKIKQLDDFGKQFPNSTLMPYVYRDYYQTDYALKNLVGTMEYADRVVALGDKVDTQWRLEALVARAQAYDAGPNHNSLTAFKARDAAALGYRYALHRRDLPGAPDLVFPSRRKIILVHGCFWHQHKGCIDGRIPKSREDYWQPKLLSNVERDRRNISKLRRGGWKIMKVWECDTADKIGLIARLVRFLGPTRN